MGVRWSSVCASVCTRVKKGQQVSFVSPLPLVFLPFFPLPLWRRAMNHNHAGVRFELECRVQPQARQMHLMTGALWCICNMPLWRVIDVWPVAHPLASAEPEGQEWSSDWLPDEKVKARHLVSYLFFFIFESTISCHLTLSPRLLSWESSVTYDMKAVGMKESAPQTLCLHHHKLHQQWPGALQGQKMASPLTPCKSSIGSNILWLF